jgi:phosphoglycolate phosphatase
VTRPQLDHVILDWNGTLLADSRASWLAANRSLAALGAVPITLATYRETLQIPIVDFYIRHGCSRALIELQMEDLLRTFHEEYERLAAQSRTRRGARRLLSWLGRHGIRRVILSNHVQERISRHLERLRLSGHVDLLLGNERPHVVMARRSKEDRLTSYLGRAQARHRVAIIGDGVEEIEVGRRAGIWTVAISDGTVSVARLRAARPDFLVGSLPEAMEVLAGVGNGLLPANGGPSLIQAPEPV